MPCLVSWVLVCAAGVTGGQAATLLDRVLAVVNGDMISLSDVRAVRVLRLVPEGDDPAVVRLLVDRRLIATELRRFQVPDPDRDAIAARVRAWQQSAPDAEVARRYAQAGVEPWFVERWMADDIRRERYLEQRFAALTPERRQQAVDAWLNGLRARAEVVLRKEAP